MKSVKLFVYMKGFSGMKTVVKFDVPCNPWMNCKALPAGRAPALGNAVIVTGEIHRWDCPAMSGLWMPGVLPGLCVCQAATPQPGTEPGRTTPTAWPLPCTEGNPGIATKPRKCCTQQAPWWGQWKEQGMCKMCLLCCWHRGGGGGCEAIPSRLWDCR